MAVIGERVYLCLESSSKRIGEFIATGQSWEKICALHPEIFDAVT